MWLTLKITFLQLHIHWWTRGGTTPMHKPPLHLVYKSLTSNKNPVGLLLVIVCFIWQVSVGRQVVQAMEVLCRIRWMEYCLCWWSVCKSWTCWQFLYCCERYYIICSLLTLQLCCVQMQKHTVPVPVHNAWTILVMARYGCGGKQWIRYDTVQNITIRYDTIYGPKTLCRM